MATHVVDVGNACVLGDGVVTNMRAPADWMSNQTGSSVIAHLAMQV
jgi:hypothetical protein